MWHQRRETFSILETCRKLSASEGDAVADLMDGVDMRDDFGGDGMALLLGEDLGRADLALSTGEQSDRARSCSPTGAPGVSR